MTRRFLLAMLLVAAAAPLHAEMMTIDVPYTGSHSYAITLPVLPDSVYSVAAQITGSSLTWTYECTWTDIGGTSTWRDYTHNHIDLTVVNDGDGYVLPMEVSPPDAEFDLTLDWAGDWGVLADGACTIEIWPVVYLDDELGACTTVLEMGHLEITALRLLITYDGPVTAEPLSWSRAKALYR